MSATELRRAILFLHRWLGIAGGLLILLWFASGIVMLWARMPAVDDGERLRRLPAIDLRGASVGPADAARQLGIQPERVRIAMLGQRPVYRFDSGSRTATVFADDGRELLALDDAEAMRLARALYPEHAATARHDRRLESPDQWTLESRPLLPAHRIALGDKDDTWIYISERTGEVAMSATRRARRWAYASAVPHWLYLTPLRSHRLWWSGIVIALSAAGSVLAFSGLVGGVWQAMRAGGRAGGAVLTSPYAGLMRWHHYAGLAFGLFTFTWVLSGLLSMEPVPWYPPTEPTAEQAAAVAGGPLRVEALSLDAVRSTHAALAALQPLGPQSAMANPIKELELVQFRGAPLLSARSPLDPPVRRLSSLLHPERGAFARVDDEDVIAAARAAMPRASMLDAVWLDHYDAYYYDLEGRAPLPVLRARFDDPPRTWLYLDPAGGRIVRKEERLSRLNRWLYHGLHSLDFPFLLERPRLRVAIVVVFSLGGIVVAATSIADGWRRAGRQLRRFAGRPPLQEDASIPPSRGVG